LWAFLACAGCTGKKPIIEAQTGLAEHFQNLTNLATTAEDDDYPQKLSAYLYDFRSSQGRWPKDAEDLRVTPIKSATRLDFAHYRGLELAPHHDGALTVQYLIQSNMRLKMTLPKPE